MRIRVLGIVLAGGKGTRLYPLTKERAKPAVPFGGKYRIIDFVLSNFINSGIYSLYVLTQFRSQSLLAAPRRGLAVRQHAQIPVHHPRSGPDAFPGETWYQGTADAIYQNINLVEQSDPHVVAIFGGDHIYRMNISSMIEYHAQKSAEVTVAAIPVRRKHAFEFGVIEVAEDGHILAFHEKNPDAPTMPGDSERVYASMGNYIFSTRTLLRLLHEDAAETESNHDFGRNILPKLAGNAEIYAYDFQTNRIPGEPPDEVPYWRDVGTIDAYYEANMDLRSVSPALNLYNREWPVRTTPYPDPPAKFTFDEENRRGQAIDSIVSGGCILSGGTVRNSVLGTRREGPLRRPRGRLRDPRQLRHRTPCPGPPRHSRQKCARSRGCPDRLGPRARPRPPPRHRKRASSSSAVTAPRSRSPGWSSEAAVSFMEQQILAWITQYGYLAIFCCSCSASSGFPCPMRRCSRSPATSIYKGHLKAPIAIGSGTGGQHFRNHAELLGRPDLRHEPHPPLRALRAHPRGAHPEGARAGSSTWATGG